MNPSVQAEGFFLSGQQFRQMDMDRITGNQKRET
jgi:hypothetical protein